MKILKNLILILFFVTAPLFSSLSHAQNFPQKPSPAKFVNDFAKIYSDSEINFLEQKLLAYDNKTSTQLVIVTVNTLDGYPIDDYAIKLGNKWGVGQKGKNNGILMLISSQDRKVFIATGYGMEGALNDGKIGTIIRTKIIPDFKNGNYFAGTNAGIDKMITAAAGEFVADDADDNDSKNNSDSKREAFSGMIIVWIALVLFIFGVIKGAVIKAKNYAALNRVSFWTAFSIIAAKGIFFMIINIVISILLGGGKGGSGSGGGHSGSKFGGGSFGGGGAGGSW